MTTDAACHLFAHYVSKMAGTPPENFLVVRRQPLQNVHRRVREGNQEISVSVSEKSYGRIFPADVVQSTVDSLFCIKHDGGPVSNIASIGAAHHDPIWPPTLDREITRIEQRPLLMVSPVV